MIHLAATDHLVLDVLTGEISMKCGCDCPLGCHPLGHIDHGPDELEVCECEEIMGEFGQIIQWDMERLAEKAEKVEAPQVIDYDQLTDQQRQQLAAVGLLSSVKANLTTREAVGIAEQWSEPGKPKREQRGRKPFLLCSFTVIGRAVPWKAYSVGRKYAASRKRMMAWKRTVNMEAAMAYGLGRDLYAGPVKLKVALFFKPGGQLPDITNCLKLIEDALQGAVIVNDRQVVSTTIHRDDSDPQEHVSIAVVTV